MTAATRWALALVLLAATPAAAAKDPLLGTYRNATGVVEISAADGGQVRVHVQTVMTAQHHTCDYDVLATRNGPFVRIEAPPTGQADACPMTIRRVGNHITLKMDKPNSCAWCGVNATMDGVYVRDQKVK